MNYVAHRISIVVAMLGLALQPGTQSAAPQKSNPPACSAADFEEFAKGGVPSKTSLKALLLSQLKLVARDPALGAERQAALLRVEEPLRVTTLRELDCMMLILDDSLNFPVFHQPLAMRVRYAGTSERPVGEPLYFLAPKGAVKPTPKAANFVLYLWKGSLKLPDEEQEVEVTVAVKYPSGKVELFTSTFKAWVYKPGGTGD